MMGLNRRPTLILPAWGGGCTAPQMNWTANDPGPEMIPTHIGSQMIPVKEEECHGFISEEGESLYKNYKL